MQHSPGQLWLGWALARILLVLLVSTNTAGHYDVEYYFKGIFELEKGAMQEYPAVGVWPIELLGLLTGENLNAFSFAFIVCCLLLDALFFWALMRVDAPGRTLGCWYWIFFGFLLGQVYVYRLDLFPAVIVGFAVLLFFSNPKVSAALIGLATTMKLWPGILAAGLVGTAREMSTWLKIAIFACSITVLSLLVVTFEGAERFMAPLDYQSDRGLQMESIVATPIMLCAMLKPSEWDISLASSKSMEIQGPGVDMAIQVSHWLTIAMLIFAFAAALVHFVRRKTWQPMPALAFVLFIIYALIVSNKVLSPQYLTWAAPVLAIALVYRPHDLLLYRIALLNLATTTLTWFVFPYTYPRISHLPFDDLISPLALIIRNCMLVIGCVLAGVWLRRITREQRILKEFRNTGRPTQMQYTH